MTRTPANIEPTPIYTMGRRELLDYERLCVVGTTVRWRGRNGKDYDLVVTRDCRNGDFYASNPGEHEECGPYYIESVVGIHSPEGYIKLERNK